MAGANIPRYEFVESARVKNNKCKNKTPGLLLINSNFTFHFNKWSPNKEIAYYNCASKRTGACTATAIVTKLTSDSTQDDSFRYILSKWDDAQEHNHEGDKAKIIAERIMSEMIQQVEVILYKVLLK